MKSIKGLPRIYRMRAEGKFSFSQAIDDQVTMHQHNHEMPSVFIKPNSCGIQLFQIKRLNSLAKCATP